MLFQMIISGNIIFADSSFISVVSRDFKRLFESHYEHMFLITAGAVRVAKGREGLDCLSLAKRRHSLACLHSYYLSQFLDWNFIASTIDDDISESCALAAGQGDYRFTGLPWRMNISPEQ